MLETLRVTFFDILAGVGVYLGYGAGAENGDTEWDDNQKRVVKQIIKGGLRRFYYCGINWSFLKPMATVTLASGESTVKLPDDYGSAEGRVNVENWGRPLDFGPIGEVYRKHSEQPDATGRPVCLCEEPLKSTGMREQRRQLKVWPIADQDYALTLQYNLNPTYLSGEFPFAYGGQQHAETILSACKAYAEMDLDNLKDGPQQKEFMRLLAVSAEVDSRNKPQLLGLNLDRSDWMDDGRNARLFETVTIAGLTPA